MKFKLGEETLVSTQHRVLFFAAGCSYVSDEVARALRGQQQEYQRLSFENRAIWRKRDQLAKTLPQDQYEELMKDQLKRHASKVV